MSAMSMPVSCRKLQMIIRELRLAQNKDLCLVWGLCETKN
jgi:hypothetical protein